MRSWLRASAYAVYEALANCRDTADSNDPSLPQQLTSIMAVLAPSGDAHLFLTLEWLARTGRKYQSSLDSPETAEPAKACLAVSAHNANLHHWQGCEHAYTMT